MDQRVVQNTFDKDDPMADYVPELYEETRNMPVLRLGVGLMRKLGHLQLTWVEFYRMGALAIRKR